MKLYQNGGWYFPDHEEHLIGWLSKVNDKVDGRLRYQGKKQDEAMKWCKKFRTAIDVGAHVGLFSYYLAKKFECVIAFEPVMEHRLCFGKNVVANNVILRAMALGETTGNVSMHTSNGSSGDSWINGDGIIPRSRLDDIEYQDVDFIKIDCEGTELLVLRGAEETIKRCRPCIMVEQKPGHAQRFGLHETGAVDYLKSLGATLRAEMSGDFIFSFA